ncbi:hypothetical protein [Bacteroidetes bacterium endosymbiont of Geopemphigus sp.]|uniref:hypothetical protein n=1 Tax=Bacteroidetes bacterium endosymbiont of Geopemphigus sp. TaxID=2047937 RepID=UPI0011AF4F21|nr:hypothetical protein [Bacteroidetes bacterium endosymbiont of Geopemphigus sp.]
MKRIVSAGFDIDCIVAIRRLVRAPCDPKPSKIIDGVYPHRARLNIHPSVKLILQTQSALHK